MFIVKQTTEIIFENENCSNTETNGKMIEYKFSKDGIKEMYHDTTIECFQALEDGTINDITFKIEMGNQFIKIPVSADCMEEIFAALENCLEYF